MKRFFIFFFIFLAGFSFAQNEPPSTPVIIQYNPNWTWPTLGNQYDKPKVEPTPTKPENLFLPKFGSVEVLLKKAKSSNTLVFGRGEIVKLLGVYSPPLKTMSEDQQYYEDLAIEFYKKNALGKKAILEFDWRKHDDEGNFLAYVFLTDGKLLNTEIIKHGLAKGDFSFPFDKKEEFSAAEIEARIDKKGLWINPPEPLPTETPLPKAPPRYTVYWLRDGAQYHLKDCPNLNRIARKRIRGSLKAALQTGLKPCSVCCPPGHPLFNEKLSTAEEEVSSETDY